MFNKTSFITGGGGFIGGHLVRSLKNQGKDVVVIERPGFDAGRIPADVELRIADIRDRTAVSQVLHDCRGSEVYHLAANPHLWVRDRCEFDRVNHLGARHVLDSALAHGAEKVLHCSTESILTKANWPNDRAIDEQVQIVESDAVGPYCLSKLRAEEYARSLAEQGHPVYIANPTMPVGPDDPGPSPPTCLILDFIQGRMPAYMDCCLNLVDVRDVAEGMTLIMQKGTPGRRNLLSGENLTLGRLLQILSQLTGQKVPRIKIPYGLGLGYAYASEFIADWFTGIRPQASVTGLKLARRIMHFDASATQEILGWQPRPIEFSLKETLTWYNS